MKAIEKPATVLLGAFQDTLLYDLIAEVRKQRALRAWQEMDRPSHRQPHSSRR